MAMMQFSNRYREEETYSVDEGTTHPDFIRSFGATRFSRKTNSLIYKFLSEYVDLELFDKSFYFCEGDIGVFNTFSGIDHCLYDARDIPALAAEFKGAENAKARCCGLIEIFENYSSDDVYSKTLTKLALSCLGKKDVFVLATTEARLNEASFATDLQKSHLYITAVFYLTSKSISYSPFNSNFVYDLAYEHGLYLVILEATETKEQFVGEISNPDLLPVMLKNFKSRLSTDSFDTGKVVTAGAWRGAESWKKKSVKEESAEELRRFVREYGDQSTLKFSGLVSRVLRDLEMDGPDFTSGVMLRGLLKGLDVTSISEFDLKSVDRQRSMAVFEIDEKIANARYLVAYFKSKLGKLAVKSVLGRDTGMISEQELLSIDVVLPSIEIQNSIISTMDRFDSLKSSFDKLGFEWLLNPRYFQDAAKKIDNVMEVLGILSDTEKIVRLIESGESKTVEFKQSLVTDVKTGKREKFIEDSVVKTIGAFLNSSGGTLIVGVSDGKDFCGLDDEIRKFFSGSSDKCLLHVRNLLKERIGADQYPNIAYRLVNIDASTLLLVECNMSKEPVYVDEREFFVRTNPATDKLEGPRLLKYIQNRFR